MHRKAKPSLGPEAPSGGSALPTSFRFYKGIVLMSSNIQAVLLGALLQDCDFVKQWCNDSGGLARHDKYVG